jgi:hypothetical protein
MRKITVAGIIAALVWMAADDRAAAQKKKNKTNVTPATAEEYKQLRALREVIGKLASVDTQTVTLDVEYHIPVPGKGGRQGNLNALQREYQEVVRQQTRLLTAQNPVQFERRLVQLQVQMQRLQNQMANQQLRLANPGGKTKKAYKEFDLEPVEKLVVRRWVLPVEYDDKGNVKEYTKDEIAALRGKDKSVPGYQAKPEDLQAGQTVRVYLLAPKPAKKAAKKEEENDAKTPSSTIARPQVRMVLILAEPNEPAAPPKEKKKKKQNN